MSTEPLAVMRTAGFDVTVELGRGMEGVVAALDDDRVVKLWDRRPIEEVERLRVFYAAVDAGLREAGVGLTVPSIEDVAEAGGFVLTVHPRLRGLPGGPGPGPVVEVLAGLARVEPHPDMAVLPVPDGETPFDPSVPFGESLGELVRRRAALVPDWVATDLAARMADELAALEPVPPRLIHGDLGPVHVLLEDGRPTGLLDFGYVSTVGDPAFDAAVAACLQDMFGPGAAVATAAFDDVTTARFGYDPDVLVLYRAAYGLVTASCLSGHPGQHVDWCLALIATWSR